MVGSRSNLGSLSEIKHNSNPAPVYSNSEGVCIQGRTTGEVRGEDGGVVRLYLLGGVQGVVSRCNISSSKLGLL